MRVLIVDDERLARLELRRLLSAHPEVEVVGEAVNVAEASALVDKLAPDLLLLDVQMPDGSGFDLLQRLDDPPEVVFTTAFDQYAVDAFTANALDYLLKPIAPERLAAALRKVDARHAAGEPALARGSRIFIKDGERCWFVRLEAIRLFESEGNYARVYFDTHRPLLLRSLNQLEQRLDPQQFVRASRRYIVNLDCVADVGPSASGGLTLTLSDGAKVEMSRRRSAEFKNLTRL